jgi:transcription factor IIIB subunit 2
MVSCQSCKINDEKMINVIYGLSYCLECGKILEEEQFSDNVQFFRGKSGTSQVSGKVVNDSNSSSIAWNHNEKTFFKTRSINHVYAEIFNIVERLGIRPKECVIDATINLYNFASKFSYFQGKTLNQVIAACCYVVCRQESKPYMLMDFSSKMHLNTTKIGKVFLELCKLFHLNKQPIFYLPLDPYLLIRRFVDLLNFGKRKKEIIVTIICLVNDMKNVWMQTGRQPAGICGAALFLSSIAHNTLRNKSEIIKISHVGDQTLKRRIYEIFLNFKSKALFTSYVAENEPYARKIDLNKDALNITMTNKTKKHLLNQDVCEHVKLKRMKAFVKGKCHICFVSYLKVSGGMEGNLNPHIHYMFDKIKYTKGNDCLFTIASPTNIMKTSNFQIYNNSNMSIQPTDFTNTISMKPCIVNKKKIQSLVVKKCSSDNGTNIFLLSNNKEDAYLSETVSDDLSELESSQIKELLQNEDEARIKNMVWIKLNHKYLETKIQRAQS